MNVRLNEYAAFQRALDSERSTVDPASGPIDLEALARYLRDLACSPLSVRARGTGVMGSTVEEEVVERPALAMHGGSFPIAVAHLGSGDLDAIARTLAAKVAQATGLFQNAPVVIDLQEISDSSLEIPALLDVLRRYGLIPIAVRHGTDAQHDAAQRAGLGVLHGGRITAESGRPGSLSDFAAPSDPTPVLSPVEGGNGPAGLTPTAGPPAAGPAGPPPARSGRIITQPVRSGQRVVATDGDLVILAPVNTGAEVLAAGNVHVYAPLRGRAMAGLLGDTGARIFTLALQAELVAIAGVYRAIEDDLPEEIRNQPAQVWLDGDRLMIVPLAAGPLASPRAAGNDAKHPRK